MRMRGSALRSNVNKALKPIWRISFWKWNELPYIHWNVEGKARSKGNHDLRMGLGNGFGRWIEEKSEENKVSFQVFTCYFQDAGLTLNYIFSWVDNTVQVCYLVWILLGFIFSIIIDGDFVRFFTMNMAYWISLDDYILTDLQEIF